MSAILREAPKRPSVSVPLSFCPMFGFSGLWSIKDLWGVERRNLGQNGTVGPALRRNISHQFHLPGAFLDPRVLPYNIAIVKLCGTV